MRLALRNIVSHRAPADAVGLIQEEFSIAQRRLGVLIDGDNDRLDMVVAPPLAGKAAAA
jgi:hypothetical protein